MKFQPKRFVVEVRRGTNRADFASPDPSSDRFSNAEAMLFGEAPKPTSQPKLPGNTSGDALSGRVLPSLVEPPPPTVEDLPPPVRRGRKPGSKNKPKLHLASDPDMVAERPRRGRKPGSKNKPKLIASNAVAAGRFAAGAAHYSGFADAGATWQHNEAPEPIQAKLPSAASSEALDQRQAGQQAPRLRDRSSILRRYVLDLDPRPGQAGAFRARRLARAAR